MNTFNLSQVIRDYKLKESDVARLLYPNISYPTRAMDRVIKGEAELKTGQLEALAEFIGIETKYLFCKPEELDKKPNTIEFHNGSYKANIFTGGKTTMVVFHKGLKIATKEISGDSIEVVTKSFEEIINQQKSK